MSKPYAFVFWQSKEPMPPYISLCLRTHERNLSEAFELVQLDFESCIDWIAERDELYQMCIPASEGRSHSLEGRRWAIFSDLLRVALINRYGGLWIDADTIAFPQFALLADLIPRYSLLSSESEGMRIANGVMAGCKDSQFFKDFYSNLTKLLKDKKDAQEMEAGWGEYGFSVLRDLLAEWRRDDIFIMPMGMTIPFDTESSSLAFDQVDRFEEVIPITAIGMSFFNNSTGQTHRSKTEQMLLNEDTFFSRAYNIAMGSPTEGKNYLVLENSAQLIPLNRFRLARDVVRANQKKNQNLELLKDKLKERNSSIVRLKEAARKLAVNDESISNKGDHRKKVFSTIFADGLWNQGGSKSGCGSSLRQTESLRHTLPKFLSKHNIQSLLDVPCGDFNWMQHMDLSGIQYIGGDIVPEIIAENEKFSSEDRRFKIIDIVNDELPRADCILIRDCYSHLSNAEVTQSLKNIAKSDCKFVLITQFPVSGTNIDIKVGDFRCINFEEAPFNLPPPLDVLNENHPNQKFGDKSLALWRRDDLKL